MKKIRKRIISFVMALCMVASLVLTTGATDVKAATKTSTTAHFKVTYNDNGTISVEPTASWLTLSQVFVYTNASANQAQSIWLRNYNDGTGYHLNGDTGGKAAFHQIWTTMTDKVFTSNEAITGTQYVAICMQDTNENGYILGYSVTPASVDCGTATDSPTVRAGGGVQTTSAGFDSAFSEGMIVRYVPHTITATQDTTGAAGTGTVTFNDGTTTSADILAATDKKIATGVTSGTITMTPAADSWVSSYSVTNDAGTALVAAGEKLTGQRTIPLPNINTTGGVKITVAFSKQETVPGMAPGLQVAPTDVFTTTRAAGNLAWRQTDADNQISYKEALTYNYNAVAANYMLGSQFGNSATFGVNPLSDPKVTMVSNFAGAASYKNATPTNIAAQRNAVQNYNFDFGVKPNQLVPGTFKQTVESDYYTASSICPNHWYHVYGTTAHQDGLTRTIKINKDTMTFAIDKDTYTYGATDIVPTFTPASAGTTGSQARVDMSKVTYSYEGTGSTTYAATATAPTMPGTYKVTASYSGDDYIQAYTGVTALSDTYTIIKQTGAAAIMPTISGVGTNDITLAASSIVEGQEYTIDGTTWLTAAQLQAAGYKFSGLVEGRGYTIQTRAAETPTVYAGAISSLSFTYTKLSVSGTVSSTDGTEVTGTDLPATVTLKNSQGTTLTVQTAADGTYNTILLAGANGSFTYDVSAIGKDGYKAATPQSTAFSTGNQVKNITMTLTTKGQALEDANDFIDSEITPAGGTPITEVNKETVEKILASEDDWDELTTDGAKADVNEILTRVAGKAIDYTDILRQAHQLVTDERDRFVTSYLTGTNADGTPYIYTGVESGNLDQILSGVDDWAGMTGSMKAAIDAKLVENGTNPDSYEELIQAAKDLAATNGTEFIRNKLTTPDGNVITATNDDNYKQILASEEDWNKLSQAEKDEVNKQLKAINPTCTYEGMLTQAKNKTAVEVHRGTRTAVTAAKHSAGETPEMKAIIDAAEKEITDYKYDYTKTPEENQAAIDAIVAKLTTDMATQAQKEADEAAGASFVKKYLTDSEDEIFTEVTEDNYKKILSGADAWNKLSKAGRAVVNAMLKEAGADPDNYPDMLKAAKAEKQNAADRATANKFVKKYLSGKNGKIFTKVTDSNYAQIVSGMDAWSKLTKAEKVAVNAMLEEAKADPDNYPDMLKLASDKASADSFVKKYLAGTDGKVYTGVTEANYAQIISGSEAWNQLTDEQKAEVNATLKAAKANPDNYPDMLKAAQALKASLALPKTGDASAITWYLLILAFGCVAVITTRKKAVK